MSALTSSDLSAIAERADAATAAPWVITSDGITTNVWAVQEGSVAADVPYLDAEFIAFARDDVPQLVAEVVRLREGILQAITLHSVDAREAYVISDHLQGLLSEVRA